MTNAELTAAAEHCSARAVHYIDRADCQPVPHLSVEAGYAEVYFLAARRFLAEIDPDPPGGGYCEVAGCTCQRHEEV